MFAVLGSLERHLEVHVWPVVLLWRSSTWQISKKHDDDMEPKTGRARLVWLNMLKENPGDQAEISPRKQWISNWVAGFFGLPEASDLRWRCGSPIFGGHPLTGSRARWSALSFCGLVVPMFSIIYCNNLIYTLGTLDWKDPEFWGLQKRTV